MRTFVREAVAEGAVGLSTGLIYVPGIYSETDEVIALARAAAGVGGLYASHIRGEGRDLFRAVDEALAIGAAAGLPTHISHLKCETSMLWGRADELLGKLHDAPDATADQYPYEAWNSSLSSLLPPWAPAGRIARSPRPTASACGPPSRSASRTSNRRSRGSGGTGSCSRRRPSPSGGAGRSQRSPRIWARSRSTRWSHSLPPIPSSAASATRWPPRSARDLADPGVFVASDASATAPDGPGGDLPVHPRDYGTFPRALALTRDEASLPLEAVIRKMTSLPADRFGLTGRGRIEPGAFADLVVFDPATIRDRATYGIRTCSRRGSPR